ncbi:hypothetical protein FHW12_003949 [Dokdonella fugitiva]|uniref:Uncharacterized protein n=1 Tax=Dokdonella fugitiva TaxID=328517 RepID=A0A839F6K8_9GAMM|nr:double-CXXCG motif protein [Dokdonella fugitiva]MBA8889702.1 hypothetical protein [Dokdonella fugitiva]
MFYKLQIGRDRRFIEGGDINDWEAIICQKNPGHSRAGMRITRLAVDVLSESVVDFSQTLLGDIVITDRVLDAIVRAELTGFTASPVTISSFPAGTDQSRFPRLWELTIVGKGGFAGKDSGIKKLRECDDCGLVEYSSFKNGIVVDTDQYDGSDFFSTTEYWKYIMVTERAKSVIIQERMTNVSFVASTELKWPNGVVEPE